METPHLWPRSMRVDEERGNSYLIAYTARAQRCHRLQHLGQTAGGLRWFPGSGSGRGVAGEVAQVMGWARHPAGALPSPGSDGSSTCCTSLPSPCEASRPGKCKAMHCGSQGQLVLSGLMSPLQGREEREKDCRLIISTHRPEGHVLKSVQGPGCNGQSGTPSALLPAVLQALV